MIRTTSDGNKARPDDLNLHRVARIFARTWPFTRPMVKHLALIVVVSGFTFLYSVILVSILVGVIQNGVIAGEPLGSFHITIYGLDPDVFVNVDRLSDEARLALLWPVVWTSIAMTVVVVGVGLAIYYYTIWIFQQINQLMRVSLIERLQAQSLTFHANTRTGDAIYRVYQDSAMVTQIIYAIFLQPLMYLGRYFFGVAVVAAFNPWLALMISVTLLPVLLLAAKFSSPLRSGFRTTRERNSALTSWIQESITGIRLIKATGIEAKRLQTFEQHSEQAFSAAFAARSQLALFGVMAFVVVGVMLLAQQSITALLSSVEASVFARDMLLGFGFATWNLGAFNVARSRFSDGTVSLEALLGLWGRAQDMAVGLSRVFEVLDLEPEIQDAPNAREMMPFDQLVRFDQVNFSYQADIQVLQDISFTAKAGSVTALVGPTGAGKSTLMSLLLRLADPSSGRITIDDVDIRALTVESLRNQISIATQENILFTDTVLENIRYAAPDASEVDVEFAANVACAHEFISALPSGYQTPLGERATKLSSGQRQRLVIARAIVKNSPILILDEPTSALDAETEQQLLANLKKWAIGRCIFLITHRLSTIRQADQIVYIRSGRVIETGQHDELMTHEEGAYRQFVGTTIGDTNDDAPGEPS